MPRVLPIYISWVKTCINYKTYSKTEYEVMIKLVVRKHLLTNKDLPFSKKQKVVDRIFGRDARKQFLLSAK